VAFAVPRALTISNMASLKSLQTEVIFMLRSYSMILMFVKEVVFNITIGVI
jgi:hypothetical protein